VLLEVVLGVEIASYSVLICTPKTKCVFWMSGIVLSEKIFVNGPFCAEDRSRWFPGGGLRSAWQTRTAEPCCRAGAEPRAAPHTEVPSVGNPEGRHAGIFLEKHVSDGIAGVTFPVPLARVSTSEILILLLPRP